MRAILQANSLGRAQLCPGQRLTIPRAGRRVHAGYPDASTACGDSTYYVVRRGDTLPVIAGNSGISLGQLKEMNGLQTEVIWVGQVLWLPCVPGQQVVPEPPAAQEACGPNYLVRADEQLLDIADDCGTTVDALMAANSLRQGSLYRGQIIVIPGTD